MSERVDARVKEPRGQSLPPQLSREPFEPRRFLVQAKEGAVPRGRLADVAQGSGKLLDAYSEGAARIAAARGAGAEVKRVTQGRLVDGDGAIQAEAVKHSYPDLQSELPEQETNSSYLGPAPVLQFIERSKTIEVGEPIIQRFIKVQSEDRDKSPGLWASNYQGKRGVAIEWARLKAALEKIDASDTEKTDYYQTDDELFDRVEELCKEGEDRSVQPIWRESSPAKVMIELDYYLDKLEQKPTMVLIRTYQSNWDTKGGFGAEYEPKEENQQKWVIHVHRGPNGGLKSAKVKKWESRGEGHNGSRLIKLGNLAEIGIPAIDNRRLD